MFDGFFFLTEDAFFCFPQSYSSRIIFFFATPGRVYIFDVSMKSFMSTYAQLKCVVIPARRV